MEKVVSGCCTVVERILSGKQLDKFTNISSMNQFGADTEAPEISKPLILTNATILAREIYNKIIDEVKE